jgi:hypothetical protein
VVSGTSAKVNVPKEYLGYDSYLVILENELEKESNRTGKRAKRSERRE